MRFSFFFYNSCYPMWSTRQSTSTAQVEHDENIHFAHMENEVVLEVGKFTNV